MSYRLKNGLWFLLSVIVIVLDQASKYAVSLFVQPYDTLSVIPMFNLTLVYNTGAAFSFLGQSGPWHHWFFMGFTVIVSAGIIGWITRVQRSKRLELLSLSLILGGAIGNLIDRIHLGYVIDFIDLYYKNHHFAIFNIADSAITIGTILLAFELCFHSPNA